MRFDACAAVADKGCDGKVDRKAARSRGVAPAVPHEVNKKNKPGFFVKTPYKDRTRIELAVGKFERC